MRPIRTGAAWTGPIRTSAVCAVVLIAGCSAPTDVTGAGGDPTQPGDAPAPVVTADAPPEVLDELPACPASTDAPAIDGGLPDVVLACLGPGGPVRLSGLRGKPLIVNAWASWCEPCRSELPALASFAQQAGEGVEVLGLDAADDPAAAAGLWDALDMPFPSVTDPDSLTKPGLSWFGLPVTYFVDAQGVIVYRHSGAITDVEQWQAAAAEHLGIP